VSHQPSVEKEATVTAQAHAPMDVSTPNKVGAL
jgi:hypothetical protein